VNSISKKSQFSGLNSIALNLTPVHSSEENDNQNFSIIFISPIISGIKFFFTFG